MGADVVIDNLNLSKNGQFYELQKDIPKYVIEECFRQVSKDRIGNYAFRQVKEQYETQAGNKVTYSLVVFKIESEPTFLTDTHIREKKFAFLLFIECADVIVIFKKYVESPEKFLDKYIEEFEYYKFCHLFGNQEPNYERVAMKNMGVSDAVIRSRSLEAKSLNGIMASNSSSRAIPSSFRMNVGVDDVYTLTPNTSRIGYRDKKTDLEGLVDWLTSLKTNLKSTEVNESEFLKNFASPIELSEIIAKGYDVTAILFHLSELQEKLISNEIELYAQVENQDVSLTSYEIARFFNFLSSPIPVVDNHLVMKGKTLSDKLRFNKKQITIKSKYLNNIMIRENGTNIGSLASYLNKHKPFSAVFNSPNYSYYSKSCFEDKALLGNIASILNTFDDSYDFSVVNSEKEKDHDPTLERFPSASLFRVVEDGYCANHSIVICDDMGDEWADHIAIKVNGAIPSIDFIHAKYTKKVTTSASAFHEVVAQALKNIGRTQATKELFKEKYQAKWSHTYENTNINRVIGATDWNGVEGALDTVFQNPNSLKRVILATPFLSKSKLQIELEKLSLGQSCRPHYVQLVWLINTFVSSCKEFGVQAHILCKP